MKIKAWWMSLSRRDQRLLAIWLIGMSMIALVWSWSSLVEAQARARAQLAFEQKVMEVMRAQSEELLSLKQLSSAGGKADKVNMVALFDAMTQHGLPKEILKTVETGDQIDLQGMVPFDKWVNWIAVVQKDLRLVVQKAKVNQTNVPGMVEIQATLAMERIER